jgi:hypothetical protein
MWIARDSGDRYLPSCDGLIAVVQPIARRPVNCPLGCQRTVLRVRDARPRTLEEGRRWKMESEGGVAEHSNPVRHIGRVRDVHRQIELAYVGPLGACASSDAPSSAMRTAARLVEC